MKINNRIGCGLLILVSDIFFTIEMNHQFKGATVWPRSDNELFADGIAFIIMAIGLSLLAAGQDDLK